MWWGGLSSVWIYDNPLCAGAPPHTAEALVFFFRPRLLNILTPPLLSTVTYLRNPWSMTWVWLMFTFIKHVENITFKSNITIMISKKSKHLAFLCCNLFYVLSPVNIGWAGNSTLIKLETVKKLWCSEGTILLKLSLSFKHKFTFFFIVLLTVHANNTDYGAAADRCLT